MAIFNSYVKLPEGTVWSTYSLLWKIAKEFQIFWGPGDQGKRDASRRAAAAADGARWGGPGRPGFRGKKTGFRTQKKEAI